MYISNVSGQHVKGRTFNQPLARATLIGGGNYIGKSAIADGIRLGLLGKLPELGEKATFELSSGPYMNIGLEFQPDPSVFIRRSWSSRGKSVSQSIEGALPPEVENALGTLLNIDEFFAMSEAKRIDFLFGAATLPEDLTVEAVIAKVKNIRLEENTEGTEKAIDKVIRKLRDANAETDTLQLFYESAVEALKAYKSEVDAYLKRMAAGAQAITQLQSMEEQAKALDPVNLQSKRSGLLDQENTLAGEYGKLAQSKTEKQRKANQITEAKRLIAEIEGASPVALTEEVVAGYATDRDDLTHKVSSLEQARDAARAKVSETSKVLAAAGSLKRTAAGNMDGAQQAVDDFDKMECCPTCKASKKGWKAAVLATLNEALTAATTAFNEAKDAYQKAELAHAEAEGAFTNTNNDYVHARAKLEEVRNTAATVDRTWVKLVSARNTLKALGDTTDEITEQTRLDQITEEITEIRRQRALVDADIAKAAQTTADIKRIAQTAKERKEADGEALVIKAALEMLAEDKEKLVNSAVGSILQQVNYFTRDVLKGELAYENNQFGYKTKTGGWVSYRVFSGTEKLVAYMAISLALASRSPFKLAIVDELGRLDRKTLWAFLSRVKHAIDDGIIDQFVGVIPSEELVNDAAQMGFTPVIVN